MDIPLKSRPKVSVVNLLDESKLKNTFGPLDKRNREVPGGIPEAGEVSEPISPSNNVLSDGGAVSDKRNYKLTRTYSETETSNFDEATGHRLYDDGKIRPISSRANSPGTRNGSRSPNKIYSRSHDEYFDREDAKGFVGLEDEYIPGLDFGDMIYQWNKPSESNMQAAYIHQYDNSGVGTSTSDTNTNTPSSREASYLDLNKLHAQVAPQPIVSRGRVGSQDYTFPKVNEFMKAKAPQDNSLSNTLGSDGNRTTINATETNHKNKKLKPHQIVNPNTGDVNYELILDNLPHNFNDLPYSQRRRLVKSFSESIDYSQFSLFAKQFLTNKVGFGPGSGSGSGSNKTPDTKFGSSSRRSRRNSINTNTVVGRLLASSSSSDFKKLELKPKTNVDEKGAVVLGYELGKIIGFGAWGTIRECIGPNGFIKAVKIVKSSRDCESEGPLSKQEELDHNPKVLDVFKNEIKVWKQLEHDNILPLINHLETEKAIFCITDRICGGTLFELVSAWGLYLTHDINQFLFEKQEQRLFDASHYVGQILDALIYLHLEMGIVHGDLKLENVLVDDQDKNNIKMVLCDFGMSRVYTSRISRRSSYLDSSSIIRSKSSNTTNRKPLKGEGTTNTRNLFHDDSKIGISNLYKQHGPSLQSIHLTSELTNSSLYSFLNPQKDKEKESDIANNEIESNLPHSHIGSLPYASPELLSPSPPPLGPSADIWAFGVLVYTMCVGRLPFQHPYEPRLRAIITAGKYSKLELEKACLMQWILETGAIEEETDKGDGKDAASSPDKSGASNVSSLDDQLFILAEDRKKDAVSKELHKAWYQRDKNAFKGLCDIVTGCLEINITKRCDLDFIARSLPSRNHDS